MTNKPVFAGRLNFINLSDIFQILGGNNNTGVLKLKSQYTPSQGIIYFIGGNPVNATNGSLKGVQAVYSLFGWLEGEFEFYEEKITAGQTIKQSRMEILLDALRMLDDGDIKKIGPPNYDEIHGKNIADQDNIPAIKGPMVDYSDIVAQEDYPDGTIIAKQGAHGKWIWVLFDGIVEAYKENDQGNVFKIAKLGSGSFIGTFGALAYGNYVRSATVKAIGDVRLGLLDTQELSRIYTSLSTEFRNLLTSLDSRLKKITNKAENLFFGKDTDNITIRDKEIILKKGDTKKNLFMITEGEAYVIGHGPKGDLYLLTLQEGDYFGDIPFLIFGHESNAASIISSSNLQVRTVNTSALQQEYDLLSGTFRNWIYNIGTSIFETTRRVYRFHSAQKKKNSPPKQ